MKRSKQLMMSVSQQNLNRCFTVSSKKWAVLEAIANMHPGKGKDVFSDEISTSFSGKQSIFEDMVHILIFDCACTSSSDLSINRLKKIKSTFFQTDMQRKHGSGRRTSVLFLPFLALKWYCHSESENQNIEFCRYRFLLVSRLNRSWRCSYQVPFGLYH